jgi:hypothetical protein
MTPYGEAYHAYVSHEPSLHLDFDADLNLSIRYWVTDVTKLNPHFGNATDLQALSKAVHDRGMRVNCVHLRSLVADLFWQAAHGRHRCQLRSFSLNRYFGYFPVRTKPHVQDSILVPPALLDRLQLARQYQALLDGRWQGSPHGPEYGERPGSKHA